MMGLLARSLLGLGMLHFAACGALIDTTYWLGDKRTSSTIRDSAATGEVETRTEYEAVHDAMHGLQLSCYQRTRGVERGWDVTKVYEYRGGYEKSTYTGAAVLDGVFGAVVAGSIAGICLKEDSDVSCANIAWAAPFAVDMIYSLIRRGSVGPKVLVDKRRGSDRMQYGLAAQEEPTQCQSVAGLYLGGSSGPSDEQRLNGFAGADVRELSDGALQLGFDAAGAVLLSPESVNFWATTNYASLWVRDDQGTLQPVSVDRCTTLRPHAGIMDTSAQQTFQRDCPLPQPAQ